MIYLIEQLWFWLVLTAVFAALAGWAFAAERAAPAQAAQKRDRENLVRDLAKLAAGEEVVDFNGEERENDAMRRLIELRDGRIAELEAALEAARERADEAASRVAELERAPASSAEVSEELLQLRALVAQYEEERGREVAVQAEPVAEEDDQAQALQAWRLRYFEQRVRYLESQAHAAPAPEAAPAADEAAELEAADAPLVDDWRAREAEARAAYLENELRALMAAQVEAAAQAEAGSEAEAEEPALASNADIDMLLRWRLLYLERRVAHLQSKAAETAAATKAAPAPAEGPDPELWKWRTRYLEARVRHLEQRQPTAASAAVAEEAPEAAPAPAPAPARPLKPPVLAAPRNGAPDDFTLIEDVTALQQNTLYSIGVFHFDQIAAWTPGNIAWVDEYLCLRGRIVEEEWVEQAQDLARGGVAASRRMLESEDA